MFRWIRRERPQEDPTQTQIWTCQPLVVLDAADRIVFAGEAEVELEPSGVEEPLGFASIGAPSADNPHPTITILHRRYAPTAIYSARLESMVLEGLDANGDPTTWLIGGEAIDRLTR